jgi:molybdate transport system substrate-binding protein
MKRIALSTCILSLVMIAALLFAGCTDSGLVGETPPTTLTVFCAASLTGAFTDIAQAYEDKNPDVKIDLVFDGTQALRTQIEQGASPDIFVSANTKHMDALKAAGFMENQTVFFFLENGMAVIIPAENSAGITRLSDLAKPGVKLVIGTKDVPFGSYTRQVLDKMAADPRYGQEYKDAVMANVISEETAVSSVVPKLMLGEADAAFVYKSDVQPGDRDKVIQIEIPEEYNVVARYPLGILAESDQVGASEEFIGHVTGPEGNAILVKYGFDPIEQTV